MRVVVPFLLLLSSAHAGAETMQGPGDGRNCVELEAKSLAHTDEPAGTIADVAIGRCATIIEGEKEFYRVSRSAGVPGTPSDTTLDAALRASAIDTVIVERARRKRIKAETG